MKPNTIKCVIALLLIIGILFLTGNLSYAKIPTDQASIDIGAAKQIETQGNKILGVIKVVVIFIAVGGLMILGIRYMAASIEEKAQYKQALILYLTGAILAFGITQIVDVAYKMLK